MITSANLSPTEAFLAKEPGIYPGIPASVYHSLDCVSNSRLKPLYGGTPADCKHAMTKGVTETDAMRFGTGTHAWLLEPETLERDFVVAQRCAAIVKSTGKACGNSGRFLDGDEWFCGTHGKHLSDETNPEGVTIIPQDQWDDMAMIRSLVLSHPDFLEYLTRERETELSILQVHEPTGLLVKMRLDIYLPNERIVPDIKTCRSASEYEFNRDIEDRHYLMQAAMYQHFGRQAGLAVDLTPWLAVENTAPFKMNVFVPHQWQLDSAWLLAEDALYQYAACQASGNWPAYPFGAKPVVLRDHYTNKLRKRLDAQVDSD